MSIYGSCIFLYRKMTSVCIFLRLQTKTSSVVGAGDSMDVKKPKLAEVRPSPAATATYVPVRPGAMKLNMGDVMKKEAIKKRIEIQKQKQSLLQRQLQEQKVYLHLVFCFVDSFAPL